MRKLRSPGAAPLLVLLALLQGACGSADSVVVDLVDELARAETFIETALIDLGTPEARPYLLSGWLDDDELWARREEESFVWALGREARFRFFVFESRDLVLTIAGRPNPAAGHEPVETATVRVNGVRIAEPRFEPGWSTHRATVPRQVLVPGENVVTLAFPGRGGRPSRRLAVDRVEIERTVLTDLPRRSVGARVPALVLPYLSGASYALDLPENSSLYIGRVRAYGPRGSEPVGALQVLVEGDGARSRETVGPRLSALRVDLPAGRIRLVLISTPGGDPLRRADVAQNEETVGLLLERPQVRARRGPR